MTLQQHTAALLAAVTFGLTGVSANAMKLDITATADVKTVVTLDAGTYQLDWIGKAGGGLYDGWSYNTAPSGNWRNALTLEIGGTTYTVDKATATPFANYATASDALSAFASGPYAVYVSTVTGAYQPAMLAGTFDAATFTLTGPTTVSFGVPDNLFSDNTQGVSINITAVPEPATYALTLAGLLVVGWIAGRRKQTV